jgi:hypothetical protein
MSLYGRHLNAFITPAKPSDAGVHPTLIHLGRGFVPEEKVYLQVDAAGMTRRF